MSGPALEHSTSALQIVDGNNYLINRFHEDTNGLIIRNLLNDIRQCRQPPIFVFDGLAGNMRRRKLFPGYKVKKPSPGRDDIHASLTLFTSLIPLMPCVSIRLHEWEADDVMATIARDQAVRGHKSRVITTDRDMSQLAVNAHIEVTSGFENLPPDQVRLYKTVVGDPSDKIPGIAKFGPKSWDRMNKALFQTLLDNKADFCNYSADRLGLADKHYEWVCMNQGQLQIFWNIVQLYDVPMSEVSAGLRVGKDEPTKVHEILAEFML